MRRRGQISVVVWAAVAGLALFLVLGPKADAPSDKPGSKANPHPSSRVPDRVPDRYIVVYRRSIENSLDETGRLERRVGFQSDLRYREAIEGFSAKLSKPQAERLESDPDVAYVAPDRPVKAVSEVQLAPGEPTPPTGVRRIEAATPTSVREASTANVAVIDTGIDLTHPDLDAVDGKNCVSSGPAQDDNGHGTHVAGTIAARNDGSGVSGVAPGTDVYAAKVLDSSGGGTNAQVICGIDWATATRSDGDPSNDIDVANLSLGGSGPRVQSCATTTDPLHQAICRSTNAGVTHVVAAGNDGWDFDYAAVPDTPAAYPEVLTVTAMADSDGQPGASGGSPECRTAESDDKAATFSNYAATSAGADHTIAAPGVCIDSTWTGGGYDAISGTSMASPHVAGTAALCFGEENASGPCAGDSAAQVIQRLRDDAQDNATARPNYGFGGDPSASLAGRHYGYLAWAGSSSADTTAPKVQVVEPSSEATGVPRSTAVKVTFSEPMDKQATEQSFSLAPRGSPDARVQGSFTWSGNALTFRPAAPLAQGTAYTATVSTQAKDVAANQLQGDERWSFKTATSVTAAPAAAAIQSGTARSGTPEALASNDGRHYSVNSTTGGTRVSAWYGRFTGVPNSLHNLKVTYSGLNSLRCSQVVAIYRWPTGSWVTLDSREVGATKTQLANLVPGGDPGSYVSGTGELRVRVRCTRSSGSFYSSGDLMKVAYDRP